MYSGGRIWPGAAKPFAKFWVAGRSTGWPAKSEILHPAVDIASTASKRDQMDLYINAALEYDFCLARQSDVKVGTRCGIAFEGNV